MRVGNRHPQRIGGIGPRDLGAGEQYFEHCLDLIIVLALRSLLR